MSTDVGVGDVEIPLLDVSPAAVDTEVTLEVRTPSGDPIVVPMSAGGLVPIAGTSPVEYTQRWTADTPVTYTVAGRWVLHYEVSGTGEGAEDLEVYVVASPVAGGPTWLPGRSRVANYIPERTLVRTLSSTTASGDEYAFGWDSTTRPTGVQVDRLIADGAAWVASRVSPMNTRSEAAAGVIVSLFTAAMIERSWPDDEQSLQRANDLEKRMDAMLTDLVTANQDANDQDNDEGDYAIEIVPYWSMPDPVPWGDSYL